MSNNKIINSIIYYLFFLNKNDITCCLKNFTGLNIISDTHDYQPNNYIAMKCINIIYEIHKLDQISYGTFKQYVTHNIRTMHICIKIYFFKKYIFFL